jgi:hypothetical protein
MDATGMLKIAQAMLAAARGAGVEIIHAPVPFAPGYNEITSHPKGIQTLALSGFLTDCGGATSGEEHENAITYAYPMFSKPMTSQEFLATLAGGSAEDSSRGYGREQGGAGAAAAPAPPFTSAQSRRVRTPSPSDGDE